ncbi:MAG: hypothetical protein M1822_005890 [Bathelium mastoideum]|nr:MAG: hypothetical protein M1822_005890 [Bathelium mastoideum]
MAKKAKEDGTSSAKSKSKKATKKASNSPELPQKHAPKSEEIIVDSDDDAGVGEAASDDDGASSKLKSSSSKKVNGARKDSDPEMTLASVKRTGESNDLNHAKGSKESHASANSANTKGQSQPGEETGHQSQNQPQQGVKRKTLHQDNTAAPPPTFVPPKGFEPVIPPRSLSTTLLKPLRPLNLQGKQIWHIVAPASLPMDTIGEIAFDQAMKGESVASHKGTSYGVREIHEAEKKNAKLLVPSEAGDGLRIARVDISKTLHFHQHLSTPDFSFTPKMELKGTGAASCLRLPRSKPPPRQKTGLKMRYLPSSMAGGACTIGSSDSEVEEAPAEPNGASHTDTSHGPTENGQPKPTEFKPPPKLEPEPDGEISQKPKKKVKQEDETKEKNTAPANASSDKVEKAKMKKVGEDPVKKRKKKDQTMAKPKD